MKTLAKFAGVLIATAACLLGAWIGWLLAGILLWLNR